MSDSRVWRMTVRMFRGIAAGWARLVAGIRGRRRAPSLVSRVRSWLLCEDEDLADCDSVVLLPTRPRAARRGSSLTADVALVMAAGALGLALYHHVPEVRAVSERTWHALRPSSPRERRAPERVKLLPPDAPDRHGGSTAGVREQAPEPAALPAALAVTERTPRVAVTGNRQVALYTAGGTRRWWHAARDATFSPGGQALLAYREEGWVAFDCRSGRRLDWSEALAWIPPQAQIKWSPSGSLVAFEWPVDDDTDNMAIGVLDCSRGRWLARTARADGVACAESFAWSPDERRLAIPARGGVLLMRTGDGRIQRSAIRADGDDVVWHPGGACLVTRGDARWDASSGVLQAYDLRSGRRRATPVDGISAYVTPLAWMDGGRALIYDSMCTGSWDGAPQYLIRWPSGEQIAKLGAFGEPKVDRSGRRAAVYDLDTEEGGAGVLRVCSVDGEIESISDPEDLVGIPLKWLMIEPDDGSRAEAGVIDWLLDYAWDPRGDDLYLLVQRGARAWCVWKWEAGSGALRPVGRAVDFPPGSRGGAGCDLELVFPPAD
jgi:hypothetical protein